MRPARSTEIYIPGPSSTKSKYEPDASFWYDDAACYPGVIIEVAYPQQKKSLDRLAENCLMDSDTGVRVIVGLQIEYEWLKLILGKITESLQYSTTSKVFAKPCF